MLPLFTVTIFLGAVLVFGVQPIAARMLLPSFGGSPSVWSATSVFFQLSLLLGYGYSFLLTRHFTPRRQSITHVVALLAPLVFLPLSLPVVSSSSAAVPAVSVIAILAASLGIPFTVAATTGPLLQRWFSLTGHRAGGDPYFLYAASNTGSLLVLLSYPFLIEPRLGLDQQATAWSIGYLLFAGLSVACAAVIIRKPPSGEPEPSRDTANRLPTTLTSIGRARWILLAAVPSALSLGATAYISTDIAAVPLLWIVPLSLYLLSFIVAFSTRIRLSARRLGAAMPAVAAALVIPSGGLITLPVAILIALHLTFLFVAATMCHTRLAEERPAPQHLTEFYLLIAVGGALGGIFVSLVAPLVFDAVWEYPIAIALALLLRPAGQRRPGLRVLTVGASVVLIGLVIAGVAGGDGPAWPGWVPAVALATALLGILLATSLLRPVLALTVFAILGVSVWGDASAIYTDRTFFGVYRVTDSDGQHNLVHGTTVHGSQDQNPSRRDVATTYYHATGPIGQVFEARGESIDDVGVVGLGVGTVAAYGRDGQHFTFFEIDPAMVTIAEDPALFTFLSDSAADIDTVVADGRLGLAASAATYDLLIMDAFSSDAIPAHLLTREAFALYAKRLSAGGIIAINVSNRFLDLEPIVARVGDSLGMSVLAQYDERVTPSELAEGKSKSRWMVLANDSEDLAPLDADERWRIPRLDVGEMPWTDDFSDILAALR